MFDVRYFTRSLYVVLLLGLLGYSIALESPVHFLIGLIFVVAHAVLRWSGKSLIIPRPVASAIAVLAGAWSLMGIKTGSATPLMAVSQWLFILLVVTLWGKPGNRASGQMLVMSLVLMVAGAINSADVIYGSLLVTYLFLSLYCCLLFHLKVETEQAIKSYDLTPEHLNARAIRHDQNHFGRSMRRLTVLVCGVSITMGILVFLFFPRAKTPGLLMQMQSTQQAPMTGFSERVSFNQVARITQNTDLVARVTVTENGKAQPPSELFLRGLALDVYTGHVRDRNRARENVSWQWIRSGDLAQGAQSARVPARTEQPLLPGRPGRAIHQSILLQPTGTPAIFAIAGASNITADRDLDIIYNPSDQSLRTVEVPRSPLHYDITSSGEIAHYAPPRESASLGYSDPDGYFGPGQPMDKTMLQLPTRSQIDPRIRDYTRRATVSGSDAGGLLFQQRKTSDFVTLLDRTIAQNIQRHLQSTCTYTLDLTDTNRAVGIDPMVGFLYDFRKGHCEYFAGAMTLMCQSLGLQARMVIGFKTGLDDYNAMGQYYQVKQSNAHAWVEVLTPEGWQTFDPTAAGGAGFTPSQHSAWRKTKDLFDYLQYLWASSIVTYDNENRTDILQSIDSSLNLWFDGIKSLFTSARDYLRSEEGYQLSTKLLTWGIAFSLLTLASSVVVFLVEKRRMFRRAERIGISSLPASDQLRLARQLGFYDDLLLLLSRLRIQRPIGLTPMEFALSLDFLPAEPYQHVRRLTDIFYRVRFGQYQLSSAQRKHLAVVLNHLNVLLTQQQLRRIVVKHAS